MILLLFVCVSAGAWAQAGSTWPAVPGHVKSELVSADTFVEPGRAVTVGVLLKMDPEWHVYWRNPGQSGLPTTVDWHLPPGWSAGPLRWPVPERFETAGIVSYGYSDEALLTAELTPPPGQAAGRPAAIGASVTWLACRVECTPGSAELLLSLPLRNSEPIADRRWASAFAKALAALPASDVKVRLTARSSAGSIILEAPVPAGSLPAGAVFYPGRDGLIDDTADQAATVSGDVLSLSLKLPRGSREPARLEGILVLGQGRGAAARMVDVPVNQGAPGAAAGFALALLLALVGGVILNLMPCVLPVLSLKVLSLVRHSQEDGGGSLRQGLYFAAGVISSFLALGGALVGLRSAGRLIGWGFQFQDPVVVALTAMLFFLIGLNLFGVFEVGPVRLGPAVKNGGGTPALSSFASGLFAAAVATPCTAPFMGAALGYALSRPAPVALSVFAALAVGMSAPYVAFSAFPKLLTRIPRPGRWMETLRQLLGFPMMAAVVWMLFVFSALSGSVSLVALVGALLGAGLGAWIWGRWGAVSARRSSRLAAGGVAILLVAGAAAFAVVQAAGPAAPADFAAGAEANAVSRWEPWSAVRVAELRGQGKPVFIDFTARWCLTCQVNEGVTLRNPEVQKRFQELGVGTVRADWTDGNDEIAAALATYGRAGVPLYVLYVPGDEQPRLLPEILTPGIVLAALDTLR